MGKESFNILSPESTKLKSPVNTSLVAVNNNFNSCIDHITFGIVV